MRIKIRETGEEKELYLYSREGKDITNYFVTMNFGSVMEYENSGCLLMSQEEFDLWDDYLSRLQIAENRAYTLMCTLLGAKCISFKNRYYDLSDEIVSIADLPDAIEKLCDEFDKDE